jgi:hypothetical protein
MAPRPAAISGLTPRPVARPRDHCRAKTTHSSCLDDTRGAARPGGVSGP